MMSEPLDVLCYFLVENGVHCVRRQGDLTTGLIATYKRDVLCSYIIENDDQIQLHVFNANAKVLYFDICDPMAFDRILEVVGG